MDERSEANQLKLRQRLSNWTVKLDIADLCIVCFHFHPFVKLLRASMSIILFLNC